MKPYLLIPLLPTVFATINVFLSGSFHTNFTTQVSGADKAIVSETDRISFNITDGIIKDCVKGYLGSRPDDAFFHGPTPWGDLYKIYGWSETYRVLRAISSRIVSVTSSPQMLQQFESNKTTHIHLVQTIYNRFSTTWITVPDLTVKKIDSHIDVDNFKMSYESTLGVNGVNLEAMTTGAFITETLDSEFVIVELFAKSVSVRMEVMYEASLWGNAVFNYARAFGGHHFYSPNLEDIMHNCGLTNSLQFKEFIDIGFYADAKVLVKNKNGMLMLTKNVEIYPL